MYPRRSLRTLHLHVCHVRVTVGDSGLCCACVTSFERYMPISPVRSFVRDSLKKLNGSAYVRVPLQSKLVVIIYFHEVLVGS